MPKGTKYQSKNSDWTTDQAAKGVGFACLKFSLDQPQAFLYDYKALAAATPQATFTAFAYGDLNGDGVTSTFGLRGAILGSAVTLAPSILEVSPDE